MATFLIVDVAIFWEFSESKVSLMHELEFGYLLLNIIIW